MQYNTIQYNSMVYYIYSSIVAVWHNSVNLFLVVERDIEFLAKTKKTRITVRRTVTKAVTDLFASLL